MLNSDSAAVRATVSAYINRNNLLDLASTYIVALSGGADSVALLLILKELGYNIEAAHCNFHLRGEESTRDEIFARKLCVTNGIPFHVVHFDTLEYSSLHKISIEMAARRLRYSYFERLRKDIGAAAICVAHHRNDSVETLLMNLIRGTGIHGLTGIRPQNGHIIRPLLCIERNDIEHYLHEKGQDFVTDSSNLVPNIVRNKVRLEILPIMADINANVVKNIQRTAEYVCDAIKVFDDGIKKGISEVMHIDGIYTTVDIKSLLGLAAPEYVLFEILKKYGYTSKQVEQIYSNLSTMTGSRIYYSSTHDLIIDRGMVILSAHKEQAKAMVIPESGLYMFAGNRHFEISTHDIDEDFYISHESNKVCIDSSKVSFPLTVRSVRTGDRFIPLGMKGSKLVSDYLTDRKKNFFQKKEQLVLEDSIGNIIWLVGERIDNRYCITEKSKKALIIAFVEVDHNN